MRHKLGERWDLIPWGPMRWIARVYAYGAVKYGPHNWHRLDFDSDQSPLSHGVAHALQSNEYDEGSPERCWLLAKAAWNMIAQLWWELYRPGSKAETDYQSMIADLTGGDAEDLG